MIRRLARAVLTGPAVSPEKPDLRVRSRTYEGLRLGKQFITSHYRSRSARPSLLAVRTYCMFVGHSRSGGSIVGALLDAHRNIILGDEVDVLRYLQAGFSRDQIYQLILSRSQRQASAGRTKSGRDGKLYSYLVPGQWQGRSDDLQVIGESKAGYATQWLGKNPKLLGKLEDMVSPAALRIVHIVRNPFDTISTMYLRSGRPLENGINRYFENCEVIDQLRSNLHGAQLLSHKHESLIEDPTTALAGLCSFLNVEPYPEYLRDCASIVDSTPSRSRDRVDWPAHLVDRTQAKIGEFDFLRGYTFDGDIPRTSPSPSTAAPTKPN